MELEFKIKFYYNFLMSESLNAFIIKLSDTFLDSVIINSLQHTKGINYFFSRVFLISYNSLFLLFIILMLNPKLKA